MKFCTEEMFQNSTIHELNNVLRKQGLRIEEGETIDPYTDYDILKGDETIFTTIYPVELLVKVAQLVPEAEVKLGLYKYSVGDEEFGQETLEITIK